MQIGNRWHFNDLQLNDFVRAVLEVLNGNIEDDNFTAVTSSGLTGKYCKSKTFGGHLISGELFGIFYSPDTISITKLFLSIGEEADANILVEIYKNDAATGQIATLSSGAKSEMTTLGTALECIETDKISLKITACGSDAAPGQDLDVDIYYEI